MRYGLPTIGVLSLAGLLGASEAQAATTTRTFYAQSQLAFNSDTVAVDGSAHTVLALTVSVPAAGRVAIDVNTSLWTDFPSSASSTLFATVALARCDAADTLASPSCSNSTTYFMQKPPNTSSSDITEPLSLSGLMSFSKAGTKTFYINAFAAGYPGGFYDGAYARIEFTPYQPVPSTSTISVSLAQ